MRANIVVQNLKCKGCGNTITAKLTNMDNISEVEVDVFNSSVSFSYIEDTDVELVNQKLKAIGYPPSGQENTTLSKARSYISCAVGKM
ncbi:MAG: heavy-metal-associated domain-containing protein [Flavobacteriaceae bacterium]|nr:heavy-metal-associated domain-containing protein [Flavobacteriaceae bacterium]